MESLFEFGVHFLVLIIATLAMGYSVTMNYFFLPLILFFASLLFLGGMFLFSSLGVFIRDMPRIVNLGLQVLFFISGVIITVDMLPEKYSVILKLNHILHLIESLREVIIYHHSPNLGSVTYLGAFRC